MDTHLVALTTYFLTHTEHQAVLLMRQHAKPGIARKGIHIFQSHAQSPLTINTHQQRHFCVLLEATRHGSLPLGSADKKAHASHSVAVHAVGKLLYLLVIHIEGDAHHHQLGDALLKREVFHHLIDPDCFWTQPSISTCIEHLLSRQGER